jgi:hypothetical protein
MLKKIKNLKIKIRKLIISLNFKMNSKIHSRILNNKLIYKIIQIIEVIIILHQNNYKTIS